MIVRLAEEKDFKNIALIEKLCFPVPWSEDDIKGEYFNNDFAHIYVAEQDGYILGYIDFWIMFEQGSIAKVAVLPQLRKHGIGNILVNDALSRMELEGVTSVSLEVRVSNVAAISLYEKFGFKKVLIKKGYYSDGEDAHFMMLGGDF